MVRLPTSTGFTATIDVAYAAKLSICEAWDRSFGILPSSPFSAVAALNVCYAVRRPFFAAADDIARIMFPSKAQRAISSIEVSQHGGHSVIKANFGR